MVCAPLHMLSTLDKIKMLRCSIVVSRWKSHLFISKKRIARPQSQFPHSCVCERVTYSQNRSTYFPAADWQTDPGNINRSQTHKIVNWEWGRTIPCLGILFRIFGIVSLQCGLAQLVVRALQGGPEVECRLGMSMAPIEDSATVLIRKNGERKNLKMWQKELQMVNKPLKEIMFL